MRVQLAHRSVIQTMVGDRTHSRPLAAQRPNPTTTARAPHHTRTHGEAQCSRTTTTPSTRHTPAPIAVKSETALAGRPGIGSACDLGRRDAGSRQRREGFGLVDPHTDPGTPVARLPDGFMEHLDQEFGLDVTPAGVEDDHAAAQRARFREFGDDGGHAVIPAHDTENLYKDRAVGDLKVTGHAGRPTDRLINPHCPHQPAPLTSRPSSSAPDTRYRALARRTSAKCRSGLF